MKPVLKLNQATTVRNFFRGEKISCLGSIAFRTATIRTWNCIIFSSKTIIMLLIVV